jgi:23S rRNA (guanine745-N1)-methyltransferase
VCRGGLHTDGARRWLACGAGHTFDLAREGYVNLLLAGQRRSRRPGDSDEMVDARRRFLATGAYDPLTAAVARAVSAAEPAGLVLDVGCGEGRHTRGVAAVLTTMVAGVDVSKRAVALAARAHPEGRYAVASAGDLPVGPSTVDVGVDVFGPIVAGELARVVRPGGTVVAAHPGPGHLEAIRSLVYTDARPHEVKAPLRDAPQWFETIGSETVTFTVVVSDGALLADLFAMTPYRWHASPDIAARLADAARRGFVVGAEVVITTYQRTTRP